MKKILVIEDNKQLAGTIESVLKMNNHQAELIDDFDEVLSVLEKKNIDLIISDYYLSNYTGCDLMQRLDEAGKSNIPVVFISGAEDENIKKICIEKGAKKFFKKPFSLKEFLQIVNSILGDKNE